MKTTRLSATAMARSRSPSDRLLTAFAYSPPADPSSGMDSGDLDEYEVFWSGRDPPPPIRRGVLGGVRMPMEDKQGIIAALFEDEGGIGIMEKRSALRPHLRFLHRKVFVPSIPSHEYFSQSLPAGMLHQSAPRNVPMAVKAPPPKKGGKTGKVDDDEGSDEEAEEEMLPPHEIVAKRVSKESPFSTSFSVLEGRGRTLKGRDLRQVRNAVLTRTGFLD